MSIFAENWLERQGTIVECVESNGYMLITEANQDSKPVLCTKPLEFHFYAIFEGYYFFVANSKYAARVKFPGIIDFRTGIISYDYHENPSNIHNFADPPHVVSRLEILSTPTEKILTTFGYFENKRYEFKSGHRPQRLCDVEQSLIYPSITKDNCRFEWKGEKLGYKAIYVETGAVLPFEIRGIDTSFKIVNVFNGAGESFQIMTRDAAYSCQYMSMFNAVVGVNLADLHGPLGMSGGINNYKVSTHMIPFISQREKLESAKRLNQFLPVEINLLLLSLIVDFIVTDALDYVPVKYSLSTIY